MLGEGPTISAASLNWGYPAAEMLIWRTPQWILSNKTCLSSNHVRAYQYQDTKTARLAGVRIPWAITLSFCETVRSMRLKAHEAMEYKTQSWTHFQYLAARKAYEDSSPRLS